MPLFATIPTSWLYILPNPVNKVEPYYFLYSWNSDPSKILANTSRLSNVFLWSGDTIELSSSISKRGSLMFER